MVDVPDAVSGEVATTSAGMHQKANFRSTPQPNRQCPVYGVLLKIRKLQRTRIPSKQLTARRLPVAFPVFIRYWRASLHISCQHFIRSIPLLSIPHVSNRFYLLSSGERTPGAEGCAASRKTRCGKSQNIFVRPC